MTKQLEWTTQQRKVNDLIPLEVNPRKISEAKRMKMIESLQRFNLVDIPVIDSDGTVISGHQRLRALQAIGRGEEMIDCRIPNRKLTEKEKKEYNLLANTHFGEFDFELLETGFEDVDFNLIPLDLKKIEFEQSDSFDKQMDNFFKKQEAQKLQAQEDNYEEPPGLTTDIVRGDLFEIGPHRLMCGDSTNAVDVGKLMEGEKADMVFTDPPYGIRAVNTSFNKKNDDEVGGGGLTKFGKVGGGGLTKFGKVGGENWVKSNVYLEIIGDDTTETAKEFYYLCVYLEIKNFIIWGGNYFTDFLPPTSGWIVWNKKNTGNFADFEMAWTSFKKAARMYDYLWNGLSREGGRDLELLKRVHPTQKPVGLSFNILKEYDWNICFDGFLGSGTTMVAAHQLNRRCYGMEIDPHYCQVIIDRMLKLDPSLEIKRNGEPYTRFQPAEL